MARSIIFLGKNQTASQNLAAAALDETFTFRGRPRKLEMVMLKASQAIAETVTITLITNGGTEHVLQEAVLVAETDVTYRPQGECNLNKGDTLKVECSNANGVGIVSVTIKTSEM